MSKWLLPPQEWPKVTKQPLATRVHGVKGDEEARRVAEQYATSINHFLVGQTQQRVNSGLDVYKKRVHLPHLVLSYAYIHGQEYLDIYVVEGAAKPPETVEDFWDYALVELVLPDGYFDDGADLFICHAHMASPVEAVLTDASVWPVDGVASNERTRSTVDPIINAANSAASITTRTATNEVAAASFTVDLRQSRGGAPLVELHAYLHVLDEYIPPANVQWAETEHLVYSEIGNPTTPDAPDPFPSDSDWHGGDPPIFGTRPAMHWDAITRSWLFDANNSTEYIQDEGYSWGGDFPPFTGPNQSPFQIYISLQSTNVGMIVGTRQEVHDWSYWKLFPVDGYVSPYSGPNLVPAKLYVTLYKGVPNFIALGFTTAHPYDRWGDAAGNLVAPMIVADVTVPVYSNFTYPLGPYRLNNFFGIPLMGSVLLDTHRLIRGRPEIIENVTFKAA